MDALPDEIVQLVAARLVPHAELFCTCRRFRAITAAALVAAVDSARSVGRVMSVVFENITVSILMCRGVPFMVGIRAPLLAVQFHIEEVPDRRAQEFVRVPTVSPVLLNLMLCRLYRMAGIAGWMSDYRARLLDKN